MEFSYTVTLNVERVTGKFVSKSDIADVITEALEDLAIDLDGLGVDGESEYEVTDMNVAPA